jgi:hypothetical protein
MSDQALLGPRPHPEPSLVVLGLLYGQPELAGEAAAQLAEPWGGVDLWGEPQVFNHTPYYEKEMGSGLQRRFCSFAGLIAADQLVALKQSAWEIEEQYMLGGHRQVNLDPGILDATKVVLASFKPGPQKLYLGSGVWADMVLFYTSRAFRPLLWTFPDLRDGPHLELFIRARRRYKELLRQWRASRA